MRKECAKRQGHHSDFIGKFETANQLLVATEEIPSLNGGSGNGRAKTRCQGTVTNTGPGQPWKDSRASSSRSQGTNLLDLGEGDE